MEADGSVWAPVVGFLVVGVAVALVVGLIELTRGLGEVRERWSDWQQGRADRASMDEWRRRNRG